MTMKLKNAFHGGLILLSLGAASFGSAKEENAPPLTKVGQRIETHYAKQLEGLRIQLTQKISFVPPPSAEEARKKQFDFPEVELGKDKESDDHSLEELFTEEEDEPGKKPPTQEEEMSAFLSSEKLDERLVKFVALLDATPRGLAEFGQQSKEHFAMTERLLSDAELLKRMLVADGAKAQRNRNGYGPARYGEAMEIYTQIRKTSSKSESGILNRLALALALEHAIPVKRSNPEALENAPATIDPVKRYLHYEKAFLDGELDPTFKNLTVWNLRMVVNGDEPDETLAWGRRMLRNFRPDHIYESNFGWRYVGVVSSNVKYGSGDVKYDRPELQKYQNILMNGGNLRTAGLLRPLHPALLRGSHHGASQPGTRSPRPLDARWLVRKLGTRLGIGLDRHALPQGSRLSRHLQGPQKQERFPRGQESAMDRRRFREKRIHGDNDQSLTFNSLVTLKPGFWNGLALNAQSKIIKDLKEVTLEALGEELGESNKATIAQQVIASPVDPKEQKIAFAENGAISIPQSPTPIRRAAHEKSFP